MSLTNIETTIILDLYDHDTTPSTIKAIQLDSNTRYVAAAIRNRGETYDIGANAEVTLTVIRPDRTGVQITGSPRAQSEFTPGGEEVVTYGAYAELSQAALAVKGTLRAQFMFTSGDQILRTEIFAINCGEALDASTSEWAGEYQGYNLDELVQNVNESSAKVDAMEEDVTDLKEGLSAIQKQADFAINSSGSTRCEFPIIAGQTYKIKNNSDWKYNVTLYSNGSTVWRLGYLTPNSEMYFCPEVSAEYVNFYVARSTSNPSSISIVCGGSIDPQQLKGCWNTIIHASESNGNVQYNFSAKAGTGIRATNKGSNTSSVTLLANGETVERLGTLLSGETKYFILGVDVDTINFYNSTASADCYIEVVSGEIATAQAKAVEIDTVNEYLGADVFYWLTDGYYVTNDGSLASNASRSVGMVYTDKYTGCKLQGATRLATDASICAYDSNGVFISCLYTNTGSIETKVMDFVIPSNAKYILFSCASAWKANANISIANARQGLTGAYKTSPLEYTPPDFVHGLVERNADFPFESTTKVQDFHRWYSNLRMAFNRNLSMVKLGVTTTPTGDYAQIDSSVYDIWAYIYQGDDYIEGNDFVIYAGIHGSVALTERTGIQTGEGTQGMVALAYFLKDLLINPNKNEYMMYIRKYCRFLIVPMVNPWGVQNGTRANGRCVDCNRNFDLNFIPNNIKYETSSGTEAFSENESRLLKEYIASNFSSAKFVIDIHSRGSGYLPSDTRWLMHTCRDTETVMNQAVTELSDYLTQRYSGTGDVGPDTTQGPSARPYFDWVQNLPTTLVETASAMGGNTASLNGEMVQIQYTEQIGALIQTYVDRFIIHPQSDS